MTAVLAAAVVIAAIVSAFRVGVAVGRVMERERPEVDTIIRTEIEEMIAG